MKDKLLLLTWFDGVNYGTILQGYSLIKILEHPESLKLTENKDIDFNLEVSLLSYVSNNNQSLISKLKKIIKYPLKVKIEKIKLKVTNFKIKFVNKRNMKNLIIRKELFDNFKSNYMNLYPKETFYDKSNLKKFDNFKFYLVGSDQVWNPNLLDEVYLLNWVNKDKIKLSYASSICVNTIPDNILNKYKYLSDFKAISVREKNNSIEQLKKLLNKEINLTIDPVILLGRDEWLKYCKKENNENYILSYLLGDTKESRKYFLEFGNKNNYKMKSIIGVNPLHILNDKILEKYAIWNVGPTDLINYIYNSKIVITDSFHVMILAILLHKQFIILAREGGKTEQNNRIKSFLQLIGLEEKFNYKTFDISKILIDDNQWKKIDEIIYKKRLESFKYLKKNIMEN